MGEDGVEKPEQAGGEENPYDNEESEDGVFTKFVKTLTGQNGYHNDGKDPSFDLLNATALGGTKAMDSVPVGRFSSIFTAIRFSIMWVVFGADAAAFLVASQMARA